MKKSIQLLLATLLFGCGYLFGHMDSPVDPATKAHAYQGPKIQTVTCSVSVTKVSCIKEDYHKYAYLAISGIELESYPGPKILPGNKVRLTFK
ncbi:MAG: hypothetical protein K8R45_08570 [Desulfobacterales bacterium]|nr:hypothetical protein [Desulfobacterales bacterium]